MQFKHHQIISLMERLEYGHPLLKHQPNETVIRTEQRDTYCKVHGACN